MSDKPKSFFDTTRALLSEAAKRDDYLIQPLQLPIASVRQVTRSLLNAGFTEEVQPRSGTMIIPQPPIRG